MYAVIKTGGKQYRVQPGDMLVVEKLDGEPGTELRFDSVLMVGEGDAVTVGAPLVEGAVVAGTLIETRKGEKIKVFKKIRRQGYRRTQGHRQLESVIRVTSVAGAGKTENWDGKVELTTKAQINARARNLARGMEAATAAAEARLGAHVETVVEAKKSSPKVKATVVESSEAAPAAEAAAPAKKAAPKKAAAPKAAKAEDTGSAE